MKATLKYFKLTLLAFLIASCYDEPGNEIVFSAESQLEWDKSDSGSQGKYTRINDDEDTPDFFVVNLIGRPASEAINFSITVDDELTTAIEGVHYTLPNGANYVLPAGENSVNVPVNIIDDNINAGEVLQLVIDITSASIKVAPNLNRLIHTFEVICPSDLAGTYDAVTNWTDYYGDPGSNSYEVELTVNNAGPGLYNLPDLSGGMEPIVWSNPAVAAVIQDVCGVITLNSFSYSYNYFIDQVSDVDSDTGVITIRWRNQFNENGVTVLTPQN